jgi:hypothetical protein
MLTVPVKYLRHLILYQRFGWFFGCSNRQSENEDRETAENALMATGET